MADKELTVFLLDASVASSTYKYVLDTLAGKLLRGLKTDYVTVATYYSAATKHAAAETGKFRGIEVLLDFDTVSYENLRMLHGHLCGAEVLNENPGPECADVVQTVLFASTLFAPTKKKAFTRNIVLVSGAAPEVSSSSVENIGSIPRFYADYNVSLHAIVEHTKETPHTSVLEKVAAEFPKHSVLSSREASCLVDLHPPIRKTRPVAAYMGDMRFGSDFAQQTGPDPPSDGLSVAFRVELYPAAKSDVSSSDAHEYIVDENEIVRLGRNISSFVWERNFQGAKDKTAGNPAERDPEKKFDKQTVDSHSLTPAFKFSNFDLIALDDDLLQATKLPLFSAFDILGFVPSTSVRHEFFTGEALYVVPEKVSTSRNTANFQAFAAALHARKLAALCRLVRKSEKEVEVGAAFPVKVKCALGYTYCFVFVRLPYKEDEKIGRFPSLSDDFENSEEPPKENEAKKEDNLASLMDDFVNGKTYESDDSDDEIHTEDFAVIDNFKVTMKTSENSKLALPCRKTHSPFLCSSPSANRYQTYMRKILLKSLSAKDWVSHFDNPRFIEENLRDSAGFTNFFNLQNCLAVGSTHESDWLLKINEKSVERAKRLASELGSGYVRKSEKKAKTSKYQGNFYQRGNYGADEGTYDEIPDFDL